MESYTKLVMALALILATAAVSLEGRQLKAEAEPKYEPETFPGFPGGPPLGAGTGSLPGFGLGQPSLGGNPLVPGGGQPLFGSPSTFPGFPGFGGVPGTGQP